MKLRSQVTLIIALAVLIWGGILYFSGGGISWNLLAPFGITVTVVTLASILFVNFIWKWGLLRRWLVQRPNLSGTWKCKLVSNYTVEGKGVEKTVYVVIRQSLLSIHFSMYTDEARSVSISENITMDRGGLFSLAIVYRNTPKVEHRQEKSEMHYGAALFTDISYDTNCIEGHYWTDRNTNGSLDFLKRNKKLVESYAAADKLFVTAT